MNDAPFTRRAAAGALDLLIVTPGLGLSCLLGPVGLLAGFAAATAYFVVLEHVWGRTIGQNALGLRVYSWDGADPSWGQAGWRAVFRWWELSGFVSWTQLKHLQTSNPPQTFGDRYTRTFVAVEEGGFVARKTAPTCMPTWT